MGLSLTNQNSAGSFALAGSTGLFSANPNPVATGDQIRASLSSLYTASYDAATVGDFIVVDSGSYLAVSSSLSATTYGMGEATMNGPNGPGSNWGAPFAFALYQNGQIPAGNYVVAFSTIFNGVGAQTASVYFGTGSTASGSTASIIGSAVRFSISGVSVPASGSRQYFVRKAPTDALPANSWTYIWSRQSLRIKGALLNPVQYKGVGNDPLTTIVSGSWLNWTSAGAPANQFLATNNKLW
jgi:hypothetical protein